MSPFRNALITGGASGIGRAVALQFAAGGMNVAVVDLNAGNAETVAAELRTAGVGSVAVGCDVADEASVRAAIKAASDALGDIDILVTAAGIDLHNDLADTTLDQWNRVLGVNLTGTFLFIKHVRDGMVARGRGRIVCLGSSAGVYGMSWPAYSASKAGLRGLTLSAARELAPHGVTVNLVVPGPTETPLTKDLWERNPGRRERLMATVPVKRVAQADEIAAAVAYLASEQAGYVTGSTLTIDGGITSLMRRPDETG